LEAHMALFFVAFDSPKQRDQLALWTRLDRYNARRVMSSVFAIRGNYTAPDIRDDLRDCLSADDRFLVIESANWSGRKLLGSPRKI
jgi:hypothetical protein